MLSALPSSSCLSAGGPSARLWCSRLPSPVRAPWSGAQACSLSPRTCNRDTSSKCPLCRPRSGLGEQRAKESLIFSWALPPLPVPLGASILLSPEPHQAPAMVQKSPAGGWTGTWTCVHTCLEAWVCPTWGWHAKEWDRRSSSLRNSYLPCPVKTAQCWH